MTTIDQQSQPLEGMLIRGVVHRGRGRGRKLGFPTANIRVDGGFPDLQPGVYAGRVQWDDEAVYSGVVNYGKRPTFAESGISLEIYVLEFSGNLYGKTVSLELVARLRDEVRFSSTAELKNQIDQDVELARQILAGRQPA